MFIHIPLWKSTRNGERKRLYFRIEVDGSSNWASRGRNPNGTLKMYREGYQIRLDFTICHGRVDYSLTYDDMY